MPKGKYCDCESVNFVNASLIRQPWMQSRKHIISTLCDCGKTYLWWPKMLILKAKKVKAGK